MKGWLRYLLLGLAVYVFFVVATLPAAQVYPLVKPYLPGVKIAGISGSIWSGRAAVVQQGLIRLENVRWELQLLPLLLGRTQAKIGVADKALQLSTIVGRTLGGALYVDDLQARASLSKLQAMTPYRIPLVDGSLVVEGLGLSLADGMLSDVEGSVVWANAAVSVANKLELGSLRVDLQSEGEEIKGHLKDSGGGPLRAEGMLTLQPKGDYQFQAKLTPRDSDSDVAKNLRFLGNPGRDGSHEVKHRGRLVLPAI